jgi:hypothetical protein
MGADAALTVRYYYKDNLALANSFNSDNSSYTSLTKFEYLLNSITGINILTVSSVLASWLLQGGSVILQTTNVNNQSDTAVYNLTTITPSVTYIRFLVTLISGSGSYTNGNEYITSFQLVGIPGPTGIDGPTGPSGGPTGADGPTGPSGTSITAGIAQLSSGSVTVTSSVVTPTSVIIISYINTLSLPGIITSESISTGSFNITSTNTSDASYVAWMVIN